MYISRLVFPRLDLYSLSLFINPRLDLHVYIPVGIYKSEAGFIYPCQDKRSEAGFTCIYAGQYL